ncbi:putative oxidoreductase YfgD [Azospirillaceae bacterium]
MTPTPTVTIYHNPKCSKSRQTLELLREHGATPHIIEYLKTPPTIEELRSLLAKLGMTPNQILRRKEAAEVGLTASNLTDEALIEGMSLHPTVIERPIVVVNDKAALGRPPEAVLALLSPTQPTPT